MSLINHPRIIDHIARELLGHCSPFYKESRFINIAVFAAPKSQKNPLCSLKKKKSSVAFKYWLIGITTSLYSSPILGWPKRQLHETRSLHGHPSRCPSSTLLNLKINSMLQENFGFILTLPSGSEFYNPWQLAATIPD